MVCAKTYKITPTPCSPVHHPKKKGGVGETSKKKHKGVGWSRGGRGEGVIESNKRRRPIPVNIAIKTCQLTATGQQQTPYTYRDNHHPTSPFLYYNSIISSIRLSSAAFPGLFPYCETQYHQLQLFVASIPTYNRAKKKLAGRALCATGIYISWHEAAHISKYNSSKKQQKSKNKKKVEA